MGSTTLTLIVFTGILSSFLFFLARAFRGKSILNDLRGPESWSFGLGTDFPIYFQHCDFTKEPQATSQNIYSRRKLANQS